MRKLDKEYRDVAEKKFGWSAGSDVEDSLISTAVGKIACAVLEDHNQHDFMPNLPLWPFSEWVESGKAWTLAKQVVMAATVYTAKRRGMVDAVTMKELLDCMEAFAKYAIRAVFLLPQREDRDWTPGMRKREFQRAMEAIAKQVGCEQGGGEA